MLQKIQWAVIAVLVSALMFLGVNYVRTVAEQRILVEDLRAEALEQRERARRSEVLAMERPSVSELAPPETVERAAAEPVPPTPEEVTAEWRARYLEEPDDWRRGFSTARALVAQLAPEEALRVLSELWPELSDTHKQQSLKAFAFVHGHPETLAVMHLGASDASLEVQNWAFNYLSEYAFRSFVDDYEGYFAWHQRFADRPLAEVLATNAREFVENLYGKTPEQLVDVLRDFERLDIDQRTCDRLDVDVVEIFHEAGTMDVVESWLTAEDEDTRDRAFSWVRTLEPGETWLRANLLPLVTSSGTEYDVFADNAIRVLGSPENAWAIPILVEYMERRVPLSVGDDTPHGGIWAAAQSLAEIGDPSVIPTMIGLIASNPCYDTVYGIGYFGLGELVGVTYDDSHDGDWWIAWWEKNLHRFPPEVRAIPIPDYGSER